MGTRTRISAILTFLVIAFAMAVTPVSATRPDVHQVTICHRTDSNTNPYVQITVDIASSGFLKAGHNDHTGPIWDPTLKDQHIKWGDIIPPYEYGDFTFAGLNWTTQGQEVFENGCTVTPTPTPTGSVPPSSEPTPTPTVTPTPSVVPSPTPTTTSTPRAHATLPPTDTAETKSASDQQPNWLWVIAGLIIIGVIGYAVTQAYLSRR